LVIEPSELIGESEFPSSPLMSDRWLCAVDADNPLTPDGRITKEQFLRLPHLVYGVGQDRQLNLAGQHLAETGIQRRIDVTVESFLLVPFLIQGTEPISHVLERTARRLSAATDIRLMESPFDLPDMHEAMYWHPRHTTDPAHRWLREGLKAIAEEFA
jgi:LysR family nod box-dependent transcriptional activator